MQTCDGEQWEASNSSCFLQASARTSLWTGSQSFSLRSFCNNQFGISTCISLVSQRYSSILSESGRMMCFSSIPVLLPFTSLEAMYFEHTNISRSPQHAAVEVCGKLYTSFQPLLSYQKWRKGTPGWVLGRSNEKACSDTSTVVKKRENCPIKYTN